MTVKRIDFLMDLSKKTMHRCQTGCHNLDEANNLLAHCYGVIGCLQEYINRLEKELNEQRSSNNECE